VKKVWLVAALAAIGTMATSVFADVQNIRLSGDVRIRGYYLNGAGEEQSYGTAGNGDNAFIMQRTRITCEADLEDHVLVVITLKAEGLWGQADGVGYPGYGHYSDGTSGDRGWKVGISEAYVQFSEMFFTPATLKLGRQYLNYGKGFVLSSANETYNFDAGRLVLDFYPLTIDIVGARLSDETANTYWFDADSHHGGNNLLFINGRYEMKDSIIKAVEAYFGWVSAASAGGAYPPEYWPTTPSYRSSPWTVGLRADLAPIKGLSVWLEGAYEGGTYGYGGEVEAWLANVGAKYCFKDVKMEPCINANYIYASGYSAGYLPFFPSFAGYNGYLFAPALRNIHIFNVGASVKPAKNVTLAVQAYYYLKDDADNWAGSDYWQQEFGGLDWYNADKRELGWELDAICGYDYSKDVRFQLVYAAFIPDRAYTTYYGFDAVAHMIRGEVNVKF